MSQGTELEKRSKTRQRTIEDSLQRPDISLTADEVQTLTADAAAIEARNSVMEISPTEIRTANDNYYTVADAFAFASETCNVNTESMAQAVKNRYPSNQDLLEHLEIMGGELTQEAIRDTYVVEILHTLRSTYAGREFAFISKPYLDGNKRYHDCSLHKTNIVEIIRKQREITIGPFKLWTKTDVEYVLLGSIDSRYRGKCNVTIQRNDFATTCSETLRRLDEEVFPDHSTKVLYELQHPKAKLGRT